jgi:hypothetical protein
MRTPGATFSVPAVLKLPAVLAAICLAGLTSALAAPATDVPLVVHEWGTFTSLQNDKGEAIGGINSDDEPVPQFVHRLAHLFLLGPEVPPSICQGAPHCHPDVTMRLETPVIYFHPPNGEAPKGFDVSATFNGGWLSEFYPSAETDTNQNVFGPLRSTTVGSLTWKDLQLGGDWPGPATSDHVWTAPRAVDAASVRTGGGEAEKFLFYRGVGHIDAPLGVARGTTKNGLLIRSQLPPEIAENPDLKMKSLWLVHIRNDGQVAFRELPGVTLGAADKTLASVPMEFGSREYNAGNRESLKSSLLTALVDAGLFRDEAQALLNTWELSYFKSAGWRLFFLVPRAWTDHCLPLQVSIPSRITRVMVGRIELVSDEQKEALRELASFSESRIKSEALTLRQDLYSPKALGSSANRSVFEGRKSLDALGISIPKSYALYLGLGRFRNALLLDEQKNHPSKTLDQFIVAHGLTGHDPEKNRLAAVAP